MNLLCELRAKSQSLHHNPNVQSLRSIQRKKKNCSWLSMTLVNTYISIYFSNCCSILNVVYIGILDCSHSKKKKKIDNQFYTERILPPNMEL